MNAIQPKPSPPASSVQIIVRGRETVQVQELVDLPDAAPTQRVAASSGWNDGTQSPRPVASTAGSAPAPKGLGFEVSVPEPSEEALAKARRAFAEDRWWFWQKVDNKPTALTPADCVVFVERLKSAQAEITPSNALDWYCEAKLLLQAGAPLPPSAHQALAELQPWLKARTLGNTEWVSEDVARQLMDTWRLAPPDSDDWDVFRSLKINWWDLRGLLFRARENRLGDNQFSKQTLRKLTQEIEAKLVERASHLPQSVDTCYDLYSQLSSVSSSWATNVPPSSAEVQSYAQAFEATYKKLFSESLSPSAAQDLFLKFSSLLSYEATADAVRPIAARAACDLAVRAAPNTLSWNQLATVCGLMVKYLPESNEAVAALGRRVGTAILQRAEQGPLSADQLRAACLAGAPPTEAWSTYRDALFSNPQVTAVVCAGLGQELRAETANSQTLREPLAKFGALRSIAANAQWQPAAMQALEDCTAPLEALCRKTLATHAEDPGFCLRAAFWMTQFGRVDSGPPGARTLGTLRDEALERALHDLGDGSQSPKAWVDILRQMAGAATATQLDIDSLPQWDLCIRAVADLVGLSTPQGATPTGRSLLDSVIYLKQRASVAQVNELDGFKNPLQTVWGKKNIPSRAIYNFVHAPQKVFVRLQQLEHDVLIRAAQKKIPPRDALVEVLKEDVIGAGFSGIETLPPTVFPLDSFLDDLIGQSRVFFESNDSMLIVTDVKKDITSPHGMSSHAILVALMAREWRAQGIEDPPLPTAYADLSRRFINTQTQAIEDSAWIATMDAGSGWDVFSNPAKLLKIAQRYTTGLDAW